MSLIKRAVQYGEEHPYQYAVAVTVPLVAVLAGALAAMSGDLGTFPVWFAYKLALLGSFVLGLTWWSQRRKKTEQAS